MWNRSKSLTLSIFCTKLFIGLLAASVCTGPWLVRWYLGNGPVGQSLYLPFCATLYACCLPALILLFCLHRLLRNIKRQEVFIDQNTSMMRAISWCCIAVGIVALVSSLYYITFLLIAVVAAFCGLIIRVVKNVFEQAVALQNEIDYTI